VIFNDAAQQTDECPMSEKSQLSLYEFASCPYCARVRGFLAELGETVELRDVANDRSRLLELVGATGSQMVPCLRIEKPEGEVEWMRESADIIEYLRDHFATA
jgi:glutathione S-transferase